MLTHVNVRLDAPLLWVAGLGAGVSKSIGGVETNAGVVGIDEALTDFMDRKKASMDDAWY